eukprot:5665482-Pleurochrysis_carterae.AAC.2
MTTTPAGGRFSGRTAGRFQYSFAVQGNLIPGCLLRFSLVPPCLQTGVNFGCSAFLAAIDRAAQQLRQLGDTIYRQIDSGPDNDGCETHALHAMFVHHGVVDKVVGLRLQPKHSHNLADRGNSMLKE